jgi:hypothetical protein
MAYLTDSTGAKADPACFCPHFNNRYSPYSGDESYTLQLTDADRYSSKGASQTTVPFPYNSDNSPKTKDELEAERNTAEFKQFFYISVGVF